MNSEDQELELAARLEQVHQQMASGRNADNDINMSDRMFSGTLRSKLAVLAMIERARRSTAERGDTASGGSTEGGDGGNGGGAVDGFLPVLNLGDSTDLAHDPGLAPRVLGRFEIQEIIGRGGFGLVFRAYDPQLSRNVALKVPRLDALSPAGQARFLREARAAAILAHPQIVTIYEAGRIGPVLYAAYQLVEGPTLAEWLAEHTGPVSLGLAAKIIAALATAIQHAHSRGIVHRDLKPSNILIESHGQDQTDEDSWVASLRITDFGLARMDDQEPMKLTQSGAILGTPAYMAPEQARSGLTPISPATDVYALGAMLYELLTGDPPFPQSSYASAIRAIEFDDPRSPRLLRPDLPRDLEAVNLRCLEKNPARRYASAALLDDDLRRFLDGRSVSARMPTTAEKIGRWCRRYPAVALASGIAVTAVLLGFAISVWEWRSAVAAARQAEQNFRQAEVAIDRMLEHAGDSLQGIPQLERLQRDLYTEAIALQSKLLDQRPQDAHARLQTARAFRRLAPMQSRARDFDTALESIRQAESLLHEIDQKGQDPRQLAWEHALCESVKSEILGGQRSFPEAEAAASTAVNTMETIPRRELSEMQVRQLAAAHFQLGNARNQFEQTAHARQSFLSALSLLNELSIADQQSIAVRMLCCNVHLALGRNARFLGKKDEASAYYEEAIEIAEQIIEDHPHLINLRGRYADALLNLGVIRGEQGQHEAELEFKTRSAEVLRKLVDSFPDSIVHLEQWCFALESRGRALRSLDRPADACLALKEAIDAIQQGVDRFPESPEFVEMLATAHRSLGKTYMDLGDLPNAELALIPAVQASDRLLAEHSITMEHLHTSSIAYLNLSRLRVKQDQLSEAMLLLDRGFAQVTQAMAANPGYRTSASWFHGDYCKLHSRLGHHEQALSAAKAIVALDPNSGPLQLYAAEALATCLSFEQTSEGSVENREKIRAPYLAFGRECLQRAIDSGAIELEAARKSVTLNSFIPSP
jgi:eukaryotic-like serine/threonine-protein kinase